MRSRPPSANPSGFPLKDPKGFWVGTTLEPYGLIYQPKLLKRLGVEIKDWDDLLNPKLKGQIAQCTPDRSSSSHASYEVILAMYGWEKGWDWLTKLAANTGIFTARSRDVPSVVAKGEFAVGVAVPSYMAFAEVLGGYDVMFVYPKNAYVTPEPMAVLKGAPHPKAAHAFIEFLLTEEGQRIFMERGLYPITSKYKVQGAPGSDAEKAVQFTAGIRSFYDIQVGNVYDPKIAGEKKRNEEVNAYFRKEIAEKHKEIIKEITSGNARRPGNSPNHRPRRVASSSAVGGTGDGWAFAIDSGSHYEYPTERHGEKVRRPGGGEPCLPGYPGRRTLYAPGAFGLRQDDDPASHRRLSQARSRGDLLRGQGGIGDSPL